MTDYRYIIEQLPYSDPFLFVDELTNVDENGVTGAVTFGPEREFFKGHFKSVPVTPGVILTEAAAQIGVVCLGIFLTGNSAKKTKIALSSIRMEFLKPVLPGEKITVRSEKIYFRFNKLKCSVSVSNSVGEEVATGEISGMIS